PPLAVATKDTRLAEHFQEAGEETSMPWRDREPVDQLLGRADGSDGWHPQAGESPPDMPGGAVTDRGKPVDVRLQARGGREAGPGLVHGVRGRRDVGRREPARGVGDRAPDEFMEPRGIRRGDRADTGERRAAHPNDGAA